MTETKRPLQKKYFSQSALKDWKDMTPMQWYRIHISKEDKKPPRPATLLGSVLDCLMFETKEEFDRRFITTNIKLPSDKIMLIVNDYFEYITEMNRRAADINKSTPNVDMPMKDFEFDEEPDYVRELCKKHDYFATKLDQGYNTLVKNGTAYLEFLVEAQGRKVVGAADLELAEKLKEILLTDPVSKGFFIPKEGCEVIFQPTLYGEHEVEGCENIEVLPLLGKLDIIHINHKRKEIREVDLKYTENIAIFEQTIRKMDYPMQHSFYDALLRTWIQSYKDGELKEYVVMNPINVVIDGKEKVPLIYEYKESDLYIKRYGLETPNRLVFEGWTHILNKIAYHLDKNNWKRPVEHLRNGKIVVNVFNR